MQNEGKSVMCLSIPGNPCCTAAVWQGGGGSREDDREMAPLCAAVCSGRQALTHRWRELILPLDCHLNAYYFTAFVTVICLLCLLNKSSCMR